MDQQSRIRPVKQSEKAESCREEEQELKKGRTTRPKTYPRGSARYGHTQRHPPAPVKAADVQRKDLVICRRPMSGVPDEDSDIPRVVAEDAEV